MGKKYLYQLVTYWSWCQLTGIMKLCLRYLAYFRFVCPVSSYVMVFGTLQGRIILLDGCFQVCSGLVTWWKWIMRSIFGFHLLGRAVCHRYWIMYLFRHALLGMLSIMLFENNHFVLEIKVGLVGGFCREGAGVGERFSPTLDHLWGCGLDGEVGLF